MILNSKGFGALVLILFIACSLILITVFLWRFMPHSQFTNQSLPSPNPVQHADVSSADGRFTLVGDKIYDHGQILFTNVNGVTGLKIGPDGTTLHFNLKPDESTKNYWHCANLDSHPDLTKADQNEGSPTSAPWDFQKIGNYNTIDGCETGFIHDTNYFGYLLIGKDQSNWFVLEDQKTKQLIQIAIDPQYIKLIQSQSSLPKTLPNGNIYLYPDQVSDLVNQKLVIGIKTEILALDLNQKKLFGGVNLDNKQFGELQFGELAEYYRFETNPQLPLIVINSGYESATELLALIDFSQEPLTIINLTQYKKEAEVNFFNDQIKPVSWNQDSVDLTFFHSQSLEDKIQVDYLKYYQPTYDEKNDLVLDDLAKKEQDRLMKTGLYGAVYCDFKPAQYGGCYGAVNVLRYHYQIGDGKLTKI